MSHSLVVDKFNASQSAFQSLPLDAPVSLDDSPIFGSPTGTRMVVYLFRRPFSSVVIEEGEQTRLLFGRAIALTTLNLHFGYVFVFPVCEIERDPFSVRAIRRRREVYTGTEMQLNMLNMVVIGNADATLIARKQYTLLPAFENI